MTTIAENLIWAADGSEIEAVMANGRVLKEHEQVLPFMDGTTPDQIRDAVQVLSERFAEYRETAEELRGTGVHQ